MSGIKYDTEKNGLDMLPIYPLWAIGQVYTFGATKYAKDNWRDGMKWTRIYAAVLRHLLKWASGKDADEETGLPHLAHAAFGLLALLEYSQTHLELDDRPSLQAEIPGTEQAQLESEAPESPLQLPDIEPPCPRQAQEVPVFYGWNGNDNTTLQPVYPIAVDTVTYQGQPPYHVTYTFEGDVGTETPLQEAEIVDMSSANQPLSYPRAMPHAEESESLPTRGLWSWILN